MNGICMPAYNRPEYLGQVVDAINAADTTGFDCVFASIDKSDREVELREHFARLKLKCEVFAHSNHVGLGTNTFTAFDMGFQQCDVCVLVEDDVVLSPDAFRLSLWIQERAAFSQLFSRNRDPDAEMGAVNFRPHFNSLGCGFSSEVFKKYVKPGWKRHELLKSWDIGMHTIMHENKLMAIRPFLSRSKNIGRCGGTNDTAEYFDEHWQGYNFNEHPYYGEYYVGNRLPHTHAPMW